MDMSKLKICKKCMGSGLAVRGVTIIACPWCDGDGFVLKVQNADDEGNN